MTLEEIKSDYLRQYKDIDCKYIVLKMDDLMNSIEDWRELRALQHLLKKYNSYRAAEGKGINKYFIANRDSFPKLKSGDEFVKVLRYVHDKLLV